MSLPNYLAKIKSSGIYRFVWDKSQVPPQQAETLRLVIGYSEKGPFNTPVYVESVNEFTEIYGNISKRLERKGVYFHRIAQQALQSGPILALNLKNFDDSQTIKYVNFDWNSTPSGDPGTTKPVKNVFNTNRFWTLDPDSMVNNLNISGASYVTIAATDTDSNACSIFIRKTNPESYTGIKLSTWYATYGGEVPEYLSSKLDTDLSEYFVEIYVFRGKFTTELCKSDAFKKYFDEDSTNLKSDYKNAFGETGDALIDLANDPNSKFIGSYVGSTIPYFKDANGNYISIDLLFNADNNKHKMLMKMDDGVLNTNSELSLTSSGANERTPIYIGGYTESTPADYWANSKTVLKEKGIREALTNRVDVEYHYIVDTFDSEASDAKKELFAIAKEKDNAFAIVNFPKMSKFTNGVESVKTTFKNAMPSDVDGASYGAYYTQLTFSDGTVKNVVPSSGLVSNLFMNKWSSRQPYYIVAGPNYGRLTYSGLIGPDYNFGRSDLDVLEPMGINAIVYVPRQGTYINSNQTAKQVPVSGLSKIHIRELVIYLQNEVEYLLQSYQWELNTQALRDTIKAKADAICDTIKNNGGLYAYINVCDETNNTPEIIDNEMIILDTEIEPARGAGKMVHQLTIHKTGALTSTVK